MRLLRYLLAAIIAASALALWLVWPRYVDPVRFAGVIGDPARGEPIFWAGGCASCHAVPGAADRTVLAGGRALESDFGTFVSPNISPSRDFGIGAWTLGDFATAMLEGTSPDNQHYYPAFPYASYTKMTDQDIADLWAFLQTLPPSDAANKPHELAFPYSIRLAVGGWKFLYMTNDWVRPAETTFEERGRYLVEALGHCAECHTPRDQLGGLDLTRWMAGAPNPSGRGTIPGLSPNQLKWLPADIEYYLETGFTPDFDSAGGGMASVVLNLSQLTPEDRAAITAYITAIPPTN